MYCYKTYFAYGDNMNVEHMRFLCPTAKLLGTGELQDYTITFKGGPLMANAVIEPCAGESVPVVLWKILDDDEISLDNCEGFPNRCNKKRYYCKMRRKDGKRVCVCIEGWVRDGNTEQVVL